MQEHLREKTKKDEVVALRKGGTPSAGVPNRAGDESSSVVPVYGEARMADEERHKRRLSQSSEWNKNPGRKRSSGKINATA